MIVSAVAALRTDDNQMSPTDDDLPTEEEINEWTRRSRKEGVCGIVSCFNKLTTHTNTSSNEGLEHYLEDESDDFSSNENLDAVMD